MLSNAKIVEANEVVHSSPLSISQVPGWPGIGDLGPMLPHVNISHYFSFLSSFFFLVFFPAPCRRLPLPRLLPCQGARPKMQMANIIAKPWGMYPSNLIHLWAFGEIVGVLQKLLAISSLNFASPSLIFDSNCTHREFGLGARGLFAQGWLSLHPPTTCKRPARLILLLLSPSFSQVLATFSIIIPYSIMWSQRERERREERQDQSIKSYAIIIIRSNQPTTTTNHANLMCTCEKTQQHRQRQQTRTVHSKEEEEDASSSASNKVQTRVRWWSRYRENEWGNKMQEPTVCYHYQFILWADAGRLLASFLLYE